MTVELDAVQRAVLSAWLTGGRFGLLLTGDAWLRERLLRAVMARAREHGPVVAVGPGTDPAGGPGDADGWINADSAGPEGLLARARRGVLLVPAPDLVEPATLGAVVRAPRILASAPGVAGVPAMLARRLTAVLELGATTVDPFAADIDLEMLERPRPRDADAALDVAGVVEELAAGGLADHGLDVEAARLAVAVHSIGADPLEVARRCVREPRTTEVQLPAAAPAEPDSSADPDDAESGASDGEHSDGEQAAHDSPREDEPEPATEAADPAPPLPSARGPRSRAARRFLEGRRGAPQVSVRRGRPRRVVRADRGGRVAVVATIRAAAPWQPLRQDVPGRSEGPLRIWPEDLRGHLRHQRGGRVVVIIVDASGSMANRAIRQAKGHALAVLDQAYRERGLVAIVVVRGGQASIGLPPTRSTTRARASLRALPTGGGTPLASGLLLAAKLADRYEPSQVEAVVLTDGRANVGLAAGGDPKGDAGRAAAVLAASCAQVRVVDLAARSSRRTGTTWLRAALGAN